MKVFECIYRIFQCISIVIVVYLWHILMYFNVFANIVIEILPSNSHCNIFAVCTYLSLKENPNWNNVIIC
jgi:hypothetical protein